MSRRDLFLDVLKAGCYECRVKEKGVIKRDLRLNRRDIAYVKYILEGYEGLATVTTIDRSKSVVQLSILPDFASDVDGILEALKKEIDICEIAGGEK
ncbi:MAG: DUF4911 domain-containing protein [Deltaproteobacteria bacterium]|nr:DUF4911 domain-containing protein [Deltaproteobacteria bacterium]MBW2595274.1 DUF4911 domain-containing protein [Deltaproteobacteria bacterium]MBW2649840.1 DUF4911 domain-containing protein [Deltaproteobacteria bacterium]